MKKFVPLTACCVLIFVVNSAPAQSINFSNAGFESPAIANNGAAPTIVDWDTTTDFEEGTFNPTTASINPETPDGSNNVVFFKGAGVMQQATVDGGNAALNVGANQVWVFDFSVGRRGDVSGDGTGGVTAALRTGGTDVASAFRDRDHQTGGTLGADASDGSWNPNSVALFTGTSPAATGAGELQFRSTSTNDTQTLLDAVSGTLYNDMRSINLANAGFETDVLGNNVSNTDIASWDDPGTQEGAFNPASTQITGEAFTGQNTAFLNPGGQFSQLLFFDGGDEVLIGADQTFLVNTAIGHRGDNSPDNDLLIEILDEMDNVIGTASYDVLNNVEVDSWASQTFAIELNGNASGLGDQATLRFTNSGSGQFLLDDVSAFATTAAVPEPSSIVAWVLVGLFAMGFAWRQRQRITHH